MNLMTTEVINQLLIPSVMRTFFVGGVFSLLVGLGLILAREPTLRMFNAMNHWVSYRSSLKTMSIPRDSWGAIEKYRRWLALIFIVAAAYALYSLTMTINIVAVTQAFSIKLHVPRNFAAWIVNSLWWLMILGSALAVIVGIMLGFFPRAMAALEAASRRWYSFRSVSKGADEMHLSLDQWVAAYPRIAGAVVMIAAIVELAIVGTRMS